MILVLPLLLVDKNSETNSLIRLISYKIFVYCKTLIMTQ